MHRPARPAPADARAGRALGGLRRAAEAVARLVYPHLCLGCDRRLPEDAGALPLCAPCLGAVPRADPAAAGAAFAAERAARTVAAAVAVWTFDAGGTVRRVQHALKYGGFEAMGVALGRLVGEAAREASAESGPVDVVVPVPLSAVRLLERGYNQSAALAAGAAGALGVPAWPHALVRTRATRTQTRLSKPERRANVDGAFRAVDPDALAGRHVLLVDDVLTTGATLAAAARPLADAGARVSVAALAVVG